MRVAIIPSNQSANAYVGLPGVSESRWARAVADWVVKTLRDCGHEATIYWEESADQIAALGRMIERAIAAKPDYILSIHSDAVGDRAQTGVLVLVPGIDDVHWGTVFGRECARRIGLPYKATWVYGDQARRILYLRKLRQTGTRGLLVEIGEHATAAEAAWNWHYIKEIGTGIAEAWLWSLGIDPAPPEEDDDMTEEQDRILREVRLSQTARSWEFKIQEAWANRDLAATISCLYGKKDAAIAAKRKELGL